jgi:predicted DCC family thiol-disulfide oxidoreductase YuxK
VITEITDNEKFNGWVLYDGDCHLCTGMARSFRRLLAGRHFELLPLQTPWVRTRLALSDSQLLDEMRFLRPDGKFFGGANALLEIARYFWWAWPLRQLGCIPPVTKMLRAGYRWVAKNRDCAMHGCRIGGTK